MSEVQRYISTSFWSDDWVDSLSRDGKLLYMYLLTNESTNIAGVYRITLKRMKDDTGIPRTDIQNLLTAFEKDGKAFYLDEYMILPKWPKHQRIGERSTLLVGMYAVLRGLPKEIKAFLCSDPTHYFYDLSKVFSNYKQLCGRIDDGKKRMDDQENGIDDTEKQGIPDQIPEKADRLSHDSDIDSDIDLNSDSEFKGNNGGSNLKVPSDEETTTTFSASELQEEIKAATGFVFDEKIIARFLDLKLSPEEMSGPHNFFVFAKEVIETKYPGKTQQEQRTLFISAVATWENLRAEYPAWLKAQAKAQEHSAVETARNQKPDRCQCGSSALVWKAKNIFVCPDCHGSYEFDEKTLAYVFTKQEDIPSAASINSAIRSKKEPISRPVPDF